MGHHFMIRIDFDCLCIYTYVIFSFPVKEITESGASVSCTGLERRQYRYESTALPISVQELVIVQWHLLFYYQCSMFGHFVQLCGKAANRLGTVGSISIEKELMFPLQGIQS